MRIPVSKCNIAAVCNTTHSKCVVLHNTVNADLNIVILLVHNIRHKTHTKKNDVKIHKNVSGFRLQASCFMLRAVFACPLSRTWCPATHPHIVSTGVLWQATPWPSLGYVGHSVPEPGGRKLGTCGTHRTQSNSSRHSHARTSHRWVGAAR